MNSSEENKENRQHCDYDDTASSDFYVRQPRASYQPETKVETCSIETLEDQVAKVREIMATNHELINRLESNEELMKYVEETLQEMSVVKARSMNEQANLKLSFEKNYASLERELAAYRKSWRQVKENAEAEMEEQMSVFKDSIKKDQMFLNKALASTSDSIRDKTSGLTQELKETKRMRVQSKNKLMGMIEQTRAKFDAINENQRKKRNQYDSVVLGLLDRTVDQGQKILRRIC